MIAIIVIRPEGSRVKVSTPFSVIDSVCCNITRCDLRIQGGAEAKLRSPLKWLNGFYKNIKIVQELSEKKNGFKTCPISISGCSDELQVS